MLSTLLFSVKQWVFSLVTSPRVAIQGDWVPLTVTPIFLRRLLIVGTSTSTSYHPASLDQILCLVVYLGYV